VKYLESAGARVVPILNTYTREDVEDIFPHINGVLFPGGGANLNDSGYYDVAKVIYELAIKANDNGDYFPLWGTCLGFQLLCVLTSGTHTVLGRVDAENVSLPLDFTADWDSSRLYLAYTPDQRNWLASEPLTANFHHWALYLSMFEKVSSLNTFFRLLSTNKDIHATTYCSMIEGYKYPFYGSQWHPEKNVFEWSLAENLNHDAHAVSITQATADFFVNEARKSTHKFASEEDANKFLIYNYNPVFTGKEGGYFEQSYYFSEYSGILYL
jgi:gamma-glutamyl hydrolase